MLARQLTEAEFRDAYAMLFESRRPVRECVVHVRGLDQRSLKKAYRRRAQETHPDRAHLRSSPASADPDAEFRAVVAAYELLRLVQQGDIEVAAEVLRHQGARKPQSTARPSRPASAAASDSRRAAARRARREHRSEQPFSAGAGYARWEGPARERARDGGRGHHAGQQPDTGQSQRRGTSDYVLPTRELPLGQFLYYAGVVSWRELIDALVWQRRQRPLIGQLAIAWGLMTRSQINDVLMRRRDAGRFDIPFAEYAMHCGYITQSQQRALCTRAQLMQQRLGRYFVEQGILDEPQLNQQLKAMRLHNWRVRRRAQANG